MIYRIRMAICGLGCLIVLIAAFAALLGKTRETIAVGDYSFVMVVLIVAIMILQAENIPLPTAREHW
jgi:tetrahydromethanopterin S-methyltransferase subunit E